MTKPGSRVERRRRAAGSPIAGYIAQVPAAVRPILRQIRALVREEAPESEERISYRMPAFFQGGAIIYFAPFKNHIGVFPPVKGDAALEKALAKYRGPKGNLRFSLDAPIPYALIRRVVRARLKEVRAKQTRRSSPEAASRR